MPSLIGTQAGMNIYDYRSPNYNDAAQNNDTFFLNEDAFGDDMRRDDEDRFKRGSRNGGPPYDRFVDYLADRDNRGGMANVGNGEPMFLLDHLATFAAGTRNGPLHAEDGLRKLRQMENTTGIWTMRCMLVVERGFLVIVDNGSGEELERFPIQNVTDPTAIFKNDHREHYNSLILFTIVDDPKKKVTQADMHIFQACGGAPPQAIVDEILAAKSGQPRQPQAGGAKIPPPPMGPAPDPPNGAYNFQGMRDYLENQTAQTYNYGASQFGATARVPQNSMLARVSAIREKDEIDGGSTEIMERDVQLLNHCFDDIEKFVARLQQAAEAFKELERRKRERGAKNKKRQSGDGMLNARAKPPLDRDFVGIFQKFKLSFNLLAKLKAHIHDPNAPELIHFLFTPLSLIYEASRDPYHGHQNLGDQAVAPVLTVEAKLLLQHCLTSKELELWHALGKNWITSRSEWQGHIPPYVPEFYDGWQPAGGIGDEMMSIRPSPIALPVSEPLRPPVLNDHHNHYVSQRPMPFPDEDIRPPPAMDRFNNHTTTSVLPPTNFGNSIAHQNGDLDRTADYGRSMDFGRSNNDFGRSNNDFGRSNKFPLMSRTDENAQYMDDLMKTDDAIIYEAAHDRAGKNAKELNVQKGDVLQVLDNSKNWWKLRNYKGVVGFAPYTILKAVRNEDDLTRNGALNSSRSGLEGKASSRRGRNSSRIIRYSEPPRTSTPPKGSPNRRYSNIRQRTPSPTYLTKSLPPVRGHSPHPSVTDSNSSDLERFESPVLDLRGRRQDKERELDAKVTHHQPRHAKAVPGLVNKLNQRSPPEDVAAWLKYKGFRKSTREILSGYNAREMFSLRLEDTQDVLSHEEAIRLDGLLRLQKSACGYATYSAKELNAILQRRKEHVNNTDWQAEVDDTTDGARESRQQQQYQQKEVEDTVERRQPHQHPRHHVEPGRPDYLKLDKNPGQGGPHNFKDLLVRQRSLLRQSQAED